jgi:hypothetical protein
MSDSSLNIYVFTPSAEIASSSLTFGGNSPNSIYEINSTYIDDASDNYICKEFEFNNSGHWIQVSSNLSANKTYYISTNE